MKTLFQQLLYIARKVQGIVCEALYAIYRFVYILHSILILSLVGKRITQMKNQFEQFVPLDRIVLEFI